MRTAAFLCVGLLLAACGGASAGHLRPPSGDRPILLIADSDRDDVFHRMHALLSPHGIDYRGEKGSLRLCYTVSAIDADRAARILREDPVTRPHVHPLLEYAARTRFFDAETACIGHVPRGDLGTLIKSVERVDGVLTSACICWRTREEDVGYSIEVLPSEAESARTLFAAAPDLRPLLSE